MSAKSEWLPDAEIRDLLARLTEPQVALCTLYGEARSESADGQIAVANVFRNRVQANRPQWGDTYRNVCLAPWQFSCWSPLGGRRNYDRVLALVKALVNGGSSDPLVRELTYLLFGVMKPGWLRDTVQGATHYHVATMSPRPVWAQGHSPVVQRGNHAFYVGIR